MDIKQDMQRAWKLFKSNNSLEAEKIIRKLIAVNPHIPQSYFALSQILFENRKFQDSLHFFQEANRVSKGNKSVNVCSIVKSSILDKKKYSNETPYISKKENVYISSDFWTVFDDKNFFAEEITNRNYLRSSTIKFFTKDKKKFLIEYSKNYETVTDPCVLIGGHKNLFHWLVDYVARLQLIEKDRELSKLPILVNDEMASHQIESLKILGISNDQLIKFPSDLALNSFIKCNSVYVPTLFSKKISDMKLAILWLREKFMNQDMKSTNRGKKNLFVSRRDPNRRRLINEKELIMELKKYNFDLIIPEQFSLKEQIKIFSDARIIIGPHATGLANMIWSPSGTVVIDLRGQYNNFKYLKELALSHNIDYKVQFGSATAGSQDSEYDRQMSDFSIEMDNVLKLVQSIL